MKVGQKYEVSNIFSITLNSVNNQSTCNVRTFFDFTKNPCIIWLCYLWLFGHYYSKFNSSTYFWSIPDINVFVNFTVVPLCNKYLKCGIQWSPYMQLYTFPFSFRLSFSNLVSQIFVVTTKIYSHTWYLTFSFLRAYFLLNPKGFNISKYIKLT